VVFTAKNAKNAVKKKDWRSEFLQFGVYLADRSSSVFLKVSERSFR